MKRDKRYVVRYSERGIHEATITAKSRREAIQKITDIVGPISVKLVYAMPKEELYKTKWQGEPCAEN